MPKKYPGPPSIPPKAADALRVLSDGVRMGIVTLLDERGEANATAVQEVLGQPQSTVSHHLTLMRLADVVSRRRDGHRTFYSLTRVGRACAAALRLVAEATEE